jgi:hypothetical protein
MNDKRTNEWLNSPSPDIDERTLMDYLEGKLTPEAQHEVEKAMIESPFLNDALEGLSAVSNKQRVATILDELNKDITNKTKSRKIKYNPLIPNIQTLTITVTITVLLLVALGFVLFKMLMAN